MQAFPLRTTIYSPYYPDPQGVCQKPLPGPSAESRDGGEKGFPDEIGDEKWEGHISGGLSKSRKGGSSSLEMVYASVWGFEGAAIGKR